METTLILSQYNGAFLGPIARFLGWIINLVYMFLENAFSIENVALTIFLFTIIIYLCMLPLTYQQQKFSKMSQRMNPELQKIQKKYKGRRDNESMMAMQDETKALYAKYGVSPSGSCIYLLIQMPILFALYRVINNIPGYIESVKDTFTALVTSIMGTSGYEATMETFYETVSAGNSAFSSVSLNFAGTAAEATNSIIDVLYKCTSSNWTELANLFPQSSAVIETTKASVEHFNSFLGVNICYTPFNLAKMGISSGQILMFIIAIAIPIVSALTQFFNVWLMPTPQSANGGNGNTMKVLNYLMPLYSLFLVFMLPVGVGIYWISGALIRCVQQILFNRHFNKIDMDELIAKNQEKAKKKQEKKIARRGGVGKGVISSAAGTSTKNISEKKHRTITEKVQSVKAVSTKADDKADTSAGTEQNFKPGSLAARAAMVSAYNSGKNLHTVKEETGIDMTEKKKKKLFKKN